MWQVALTLDIQIDDKMRVPPVREVTAYFERLLLGKLPQNATGLQQRIL